MRKIFACLTAALLSAAAGGWSQAPAAKSESQPQDTTKPAAQPTQKPGGAGLELVKTPTEAEKVLDEAIAKLDGLKQYRADVRHVAEMLGYRFTADGQVAVAPNFKMLFELTVHLTDTSGSLLEVCDGRVHWRSQKVLDVHEVVRIDVTEARTVLDKPQFPKEVRDAFLKQIGFSGVAPFLRGLRDTHRFETVEEAALGETPVHVLKGTWREDVINQTTHRNQRLNLATLPPIVPRSTTLWVGRENGWPYQLRMESAAAPAAQPPATAGAPPRPQPLAPTVITLEFLNPQLGAELPDSLFTFSPPPDVQPRDDTANLRQALTTILEQAQSSATKAAPPADGKTTAPLGLDLGAPPKAK